NVLPELLAELETRSDYRARRAGIQQWNAGSPVIKKGLALTPVKFGIAYTATQMNQGGALVHLYTDGSVHLNHGGTPMRQGPFIKVAQLVAQEFGIVIEHAQLTATSTGQAPKQPATAALSGTDPT